VRVCNAAAKPVVNLPLLFWMTDALDSRCLVHRFPWFKNFPAQHRFSFLRKATRRGFDWTPRDSACAFTKAAWLIRCLGALFCRARLGCGGV
jgi:hypothetical protein